MLVEIFIGLILLLTLYYFNKRPNGIPPGIWGWPLIGQLPSKDLTLEEQAQNYSKKYGNIFSWRIGSRIYVFLCSYDLVKVAMSKPELADRPTLYSFDVLANFQKIGLVNSNGKIWQHNRRFAIRHLKDLGMGKRSYESVIKDEVACLIKEFEKTLDGNPKPIPWSLNVAILNIIWKITADKRYDVDDLEIQRFNDLVNKLFGDVSQLVLLYDLLPSLHKFVPNFVNRWCGVQDFLDIYCVLKTFFLDVIEDHQTSLDPENPRDYIDYYLIEMEAQKNNPESEMNISDIVVGLMDLFVAGSETTSSTIRWAIFYLIKYPEIQEKIHKELNSVLCRETLPSLEHRDRLPYLEAFTREVQRFVALVSLSLPHSAGEETTLNGYIIPKDAVVMINIFSCHHDSNYWENPQDFNPKRFLDDNGKLINHKGFIPFSIGKRICPGESLANMELFLFLSGLLQNFTFTLPEGEVLNDKRDPKNRLIHNRKPFNVIIQRRE